MSAADLSRAKLDLLRAVPALSLNSDEAYLAQYAASGDEPGYLDDETVPRGSRCPTFASLVLRVNNERWRGVPFLLSAGKGLDERLCEFRIRFRPQAYNQRLMGSPAQNELVMRVQPDEAIYLVAAAKRPGIAAGLGREERRTPVAMARPRAALTAPTPPERPARARLCSAAHR